MSRLRLVGISTPATPAAGKGELFYSTSKRLSQIDDAGLVRVVADDKFSPKAWVSCGVAADIQQSQGIASLTDNGTGDVTATFTTAFLAATYAAQVSVEMTATTYAVANAREAHVRQGGRSTTACRFDCIDDTAATELVKDPTTWHLSFWGGQ